MGMLFPVRLMKNSWSAPTHPYPHPIQEKAPYGPQALTGWSQILGPNLARLEWETACSEAGGCYL